ncbi:MAG: hypothetical protein JO193_01000 [Candidatus Eremiobacteraeota bacterium]|nr:hypothetical protein [Candidatus Eremiobacteraeota bacterium]MBV9972775.1 hypothetical protein [Candidatus Eremiobacteraeota bacterium]
MSVFYFMLFFAVAFVGGILAMGWAERQKACQRCGHVAADEAESALLGH